MMFTNTKLFSISFLLFGCHQHHRSSCAAQSIILAHNTSARVIRSNQSLVLQKVTRQSSGNYSCSAINAEGETVSNQLELRVKCKFCSTRFAESRSWCGSCNTGNIGIVRYITLYLHMHVYTYIFPVHLHRCYAARNTRMLYI